MKKFATLGLAIIMFMAAVALSPAAKVDAQSAGLVSSLLNRMERNRQSLKSLRATISMEKYNAQIGDKDKYEGTVLYMPAVGRNANVRVEWDKPQHEILAVSNGAYTLCRPRLNMCYVGNAKSSKNKVGGAFDFMNISKAQLMAKFEPFQEIYDETLWGGVRTTHFKLVPKSGAGYSSKFAEVWVDGSGMPVQVKVVEKNDDSSTMRLTNIQPNANIGADQFRLKLDASVKQVKG